MSQVTMERALFRLRDCRRNRVSTCFQVKVKGSSMAPLYRAGTIVECRCLLPGAPVRARKDYVFQMRSGAMFLRRVVAVRRDSLICCTLEIADFGAVIDMAQGRKAKGRPLFDRVDRKQIAGIGVVAGTYRPL